MVRTHSILSSRTRVRLHRRKRESQNIAVSTKGNIKHLKIKNS